MATTTRRVGVTLRNVEGSIISGDVRLDFRTPDKHIAQATAKFAGRRRVFEMKADELAWPIYCDVTPTMYRGRRSPFKGFDTQQEIDVVLFRRSGKWKASYDRWASLAAKRAKFGELVDVLAASSNVVIRREDSITPIGRFTDVKYDSNRAPAKAALLNLHKKMQLTKDVEDKPWFRHVREVLVLQQERFIARVDGALFRMVKKIRGNIGGYPTYEKGTTGLHVGNIPAEFELFEDTSIKSTDDFANLQLSVFKVVDKATRSKTDYILDADIDENGNLARHLIDVFFIHPITGGTQPYDIHEFLTRRYPSIPLGYNLVPRGA